MTFSGQQAGSYILLERIGMGGMAEVFRAASRGVEGFERPVAIKRILPNLAADEEFVKMFVDEAKIAVQLQHPNIVEIFDLAREGDELFIAMEYVHGKDLRAILDKVQGPDGRRGRIPVEIAVHVTARVCDALQHAHFAHSPSGQRLGIIHRDISPQNVIVSYDGEVKVTDFGLAKAAGRAVQTQAGVVKGKLAYMSPEQLRGQAIDQRSDVYGVGILLWEMLTGVRLFLGKNDQETLRRVYNAQVPTPRSVRPELHPELEAIVLRALARDVADRYASAEEMQEELTASARRRARPASARTCASSTRTPIRCRRRRRILRWPPAAAARASRRRTLLGPLDPDVMRRRRTLRRGDATAPRSCDPIPSSRCVSLLRELPSLSTTSRISPRTVPRRARPRAASRGQSNPRPTTAASS
jgi:serine/threonine protein kinase